MPSRDGFQYTKVIATKCRNQYKYNPFSPLYENNFKKNWNFVAASRSYNAGINANGELFCWGYNSDGQFANGTTMNVYSPTAIDCPLSLEITENKIINEVVYPNPTSDFVNIALQDATIETVLVYDIQGRLLMSKKVNAPAIKLSLLNQSAGLYIINVNTASTSKNFKILKN